MAEHLEFDLVSIGGGFAGLCAAVRGAELGLRTAVVEQGEDERYLCSSRWAGGIFHVSYHDVRSTPAELVAAIERATSGETEPELAAAIATDCARTVDWLGAQGAEYTSASPIGWHRWTPAPPRCAWPAGAAPAWRRGAAMPSWRSRRAPLSSPMAGFPATPSCSAAI